MQSDGMEQELRKALKERKDATKCLAKRVHDLVMSNRKRDYELIRARNLLKRLEESLIPIRPSVLGWEGQGKEWAIRWTK